MLTPPLQASGQPEHLVFLESFDAADFDDAGASFGEVALISGEPRNATIRATDDCRAYRLEPAPFLSAVTGNPYSQLVADRVAAERGLGARA